MRIEYALTKDVGVQILSRGVSSRMRGCRTSRFNPRDFMQTWAGRGIPPRRASVVTIKTQIGVTIACSNDQLRREEIQVRTKRIGLQVARMPSVEQPSSKDKVTTDQSQQASALLKAVNESAKAIRPLFVGFVLLMTYVAVVVAGIEDLDYVIGAGAKLPLVDTQVPFNAFFTFTPILTLVYHFQVLIQLSILGRTASRLRRRLDRVSKKQKRLSLEVDSFMLSYFLAGPEKGTFNQLLVVPLVASLIVAPPLLLTFLLVSFLPYQSEAVTWWHRILITGDLFIIAYFVPRIFDGVERTNRLTTARDRVKYQRKHKVQLSSLLITLIAPLIIFIYAGALIPAEPLELWLAQVLGVPKGVPVELPLTRLFFFPLGAEQKRKTADNCMDKHEIRYFHRNLDLCRRIVVRGFSKPDRRGDLLSYDPSVLQAVEGIALVKRNLRYANFMFARLPLANLSESDLRGANFIHADLRFASLSGANLPHANFYHANLTGVDLTGDGHGSADLSDANFERANLTCASLIGESSADGANFEEVIAPGADFSVRTFRRANFKNAILFGAEFDGTTFDEASNFDGAKLNFSTIQNSIGADLIRSPEVGLAIQLARSQKSGSKNSERPVSLARPALIAYTIDGFAGKRTLDFEGADARTQRCRKSLEARGVVLYPLRD